MFYVGDQFYYKVGTDSGNDMQLLPPPPLSLSDSQSNLFQQQMTHLHTFSTNKKITSTSVKKNMSKMLRISFFNVTHQTRHILLD